MSTYQLFIFKRNLQKPFLKKTMNVFSILSNEKNKTGNQWYMRFLENKCTGQNYYYM